METFNKATASRGAAEESQSHVFEENLELRRELAQKDCQLRVKQGSQPQTEEETAAKINNLEKKVTQLEEQLAENAQTEEDLPARLESLQANFQLLEDHLNAVYNTLADAKAQEEHFREQSLQKDRNPTTHCPEHHAPGPEAALNEAL